MRRHAQARAWACTLALAGAAAAAAAAPGADAAAGDPGRGRAIASSRTQGLCGLCHALPGEPAALAGDIGPPLAGVGARLDRAALRQQLLAPEARNPDTVMPAYGPPRAGLQQVGARWRDRPLLGEAQLADVLAWLESLR